MIFICCYSTKLNKNKCRLKRPQEERVGIGPNGSKPIPFYCFESFEVSNLGNN